MVLQILSAPAAKFESINPSGKEGRGSVVEKSEAVLVPSKNVEVSSRITRVSIARLTRQRHHSEKRKKEKGQ